MSRHENIFFFQSCVEILICDLLFNEEIVSLDHYLFSSWMLTLMPDSQKGQRFKNKTGFILLNEGFEVIMTHWQEQVNSLWMIIKHDSSSFLVSNNCCSSDKGRHFSPMLSKKNSVSAGEGEKSFNFLPLRARTIHTVMLQSGTRISVTLKSTPIYFCSST